jgi:hypothetical protein
VNTSLYLLAYLTPMVLLAVGVALPVVALVRFREFAQHPRHRFRQQSRSGRQGFPLRTAWLLVLAEVPALVLFAGFAIATLAPETPEGALRETRIIYLDDF